MAPFGAALRAFHEGDASASLRLRWDLGDEVEVPVAVYFSPPEVGTPVELEVLTRLEGTVLDVGAGSGRFAVAALGRGHEVTAVEILADAVHVLRRRGIPTVRADFMTESTVKAADTVLVLMNGSTHAGTLAGLPRLLGRLSELALPGGRILMDSTDPAHPGVDWEDPGDGRAAGELHLQIGFRGVWGPPMPQLFVGVRDLGAAAREAGLECRVVSVDDDGRYLAELQRPRRS